MDYSGWRKIDIITMPDCLSIAAHWHTSHAGSKQKKKTSESQQQKMKATKSNLQPSPFARTY